jgi:hypothetical protein
VSAVGPVVAFYDIPGMKRETLLTILVPNTNLEYYNKDYENFFVYILLQLQEHLRRSVVCITKSRISKNIIRITFEKNIALIILTESNESSNYCCPNFLLTEF